MRYHIDTIPVWDAIKRNGECPLCALRRKAELTSIERCLGASVMEPDTRIKVNSKGFCSRHMQLLFAQPNRLGLSLMLHTHLKEAASRADTLLENADALSNHQKGDSALKRLTGKKQLTASMQHLADDLHVISSSCVLCDTISDTMNDYSYTFVHLYKTDDAFRQAFASSKGLCLPDISILLPIAAEEMDASRLADFTTVLKRLTHDNLTRLEGEIEWFTLKFDYRNNDKPWNNSRDAAERTINKLNGWCVGEEPNPKEK